MMASGSQPPPTALAIRDPAIRAPAIKARAGTTSIRLRLVIGCLTATALAICVAGISVYRIVDAQLAEAGTDELRAVLQSNSHRAAAESNRPPRAGGEVSTFFTASPGSYRWLVRRPGMETAKAMSDGFPGEALPAIDVGAQRETEPVVYETTGADGVPFRVAGYCFTPADNMQRDRGGPPRNDPGRPQEGREGLRRGPPRERGGRPLPGGFSPNERFDVFVAASTADELATLTSLKGTLLATGAGAILVSCLGLLLVIRRSLLPLGELSRRVAELDASTLSDPIELPDAARELTPIVTALDSTRERLNSAFERERRFTADAAHELRTPLAGLRAVLEVVLRRQRSLEEHRDAAEQCLEVTESMQSMVEALLALSRGEDAMDAAAPVDIALEMSRAFDSVQGELEDRRMTLVHDVGERSLNVATASPALVERILSNIARNAAAYANSGTAITASVHTGEDGAVCAKVTNECEALPLGIETAAFEPFWRADSARTGEGKHAGLGLALVAKAAEAIGAEVSIGTGQSGDAHRFEITVRFAA